MGRGETNAKKRKRQSEAKANSNGDAVVQDTPRFRTVHESKTGREWTFSVALPSSLLDESQSREQQTWVVGRVARAMGLFCVDEVVIFDDGTRDNSLKLSEDVKVLNGEALREDPNQFLVRLLSYLETPPRLRQYLFLPHASADLEAADSLPSLDLPHHLKTDEWCSYQEGVTLPGADELGTLVELGLSFPVVVADQIPPNTRVTLKFAEGAHRTYYENRDQHVLAQPVSPDEPREEAGFYWGYKVRKAPGLSQVFTECDYEDGYDVSLGTSDDAASIETLYSGEEEEKVQRFKHLLVVFGGPQGLEAAVKNDAVLQKLGVGNAKDAFDRWINVCPDHGSTAIRTDEALWIGLANLKRLVSSNASQ